MRWGPCLPYPPGSTVGVLRAEPYRQGPHDPLFGDVLSGPLSAPGLAAGMHLGTDPVNHADTVSDLLRLPTGLNSERNVAQNVGVMPRIFEDGIHVVHVRKRDMTPPVGLGLPRDERLFGPVLNGLRNVALRLLIFAVSIQRGQRAGKLLSHRG